jgi:hypothetical protein
VILLFNRGLLSQEHPDSYTGNTGAWHRSISSIARDPLNKVAHTTLTRFVNGHPNFWKNLEKLIQKVILSTSSEKMIWLWMILNWQKE